MGDAAQKQPAAQELSHESAVEGEGPESPQSVQTPVSSKSDPKSAQFSAVGESTIRGLARQLKELHTSLGCDVILKAGLRLDGAAEKTFPCSSQVIATWSSNFRLLLKESVKDSDGCRSIQLKGNLKVVEAAIAFMREGRRSFSVMDLKQQHPLLEFASEYGLEDLRVTYGEAMMCENPVTLQNAQPYLELGLRFSVINISLVAADLLAANVGRLPDLSQTLLSLDTQCFKAVLASDSLNVEDEQDAIGIIKAWVDKDGQRSSSIDSLLSQVRLSLCSYQTLIDLMSSLGSDLKAVDEELLRIRVRKVIDDKLQGNRLSDRPRHSTKLPSGENEARLGMTLKVSKELYASDAVPASPASHSP